jgi:DNA-binding CsgD family transcriptional regulator
MNTTSRRLADASREAHQQAISETEPVISVPAGTATEANSADWESRAACLDCDPDLFFPIAPSGPALQQIAQAKAVCARCSVRVLRAAGGRDAVQDAGRAAAAVPGLAEQLTAREPEVLALLAAGMPNPRIAAELVVTLDPVKKHVSHLLGKLGAANRTEAVTRARQLGLIP